MRTRLYFLLSYAQHTRRFHKHPKIFSIISRCICRTLNPIEDELTFSDLILKKWVDVRCVRKELSFPSKSHDDENVFWVWRKEFHFHSHWGFDLFLWQECLKEKMLSKEWACFLLKQHNPTKIKVSKKTFNILTLERTNLMFRFLLENEMRRY